MQTFCIRFRFHLCGKFPFAVNSVTQMWLIWSRLFASLPVKLLSPINSFLANNYWNSIHCLVGSQTTNFLSSLAQQISACIIINNNCCRFPSAFVWIEYENLPSKVEIPPLKKSKWLKLNWMEFLLLCYLLLRSFCLFTTSFHPNARNHETQIRLHDT